MNTPHRWLVAALVASASAAVSAGGTNISVNLAGEVSPGVYGRIDIGNAPRPVLVYEQPVIVTRPVRFVSPPPPLYMHVPPGHAKNWSKHCARYNACGRQVYFVRSAEYEPNYRRERVVVPADTYVRDEDHGRGNGKGKHKDKHKDNGKGHGGKH